MTTLDLNTELRQIIENSGFDAIGIADFQVLESDRDRLIRWIESGMAGDMSYLNTLKNIRHDLRYVFPETQSVIVTLTSIKRVKFHVPTIAAYAHNFDDYHVEIKSKLHRLLKSLQTIDPEIKGRAIVDSVPAFEKTWATKAGLGWIGRNSLLINPALGSFTHIGILLVNRKITSRHAPLNTQCPAGCSLCIDACPNGAINDNNTIDARRCVAYMTLESSLPVTGNTHGYILGCDTCMEACPYNKDVSTIDPQFSGIDWLNITEVEFKERFKKTSLWRVGLEKIHSILEIAKNSNLEV